MYFLTPLIPYPTLNRALLSVLPMQKTIEINPYNNAFSATFGHTSSYQTVHICLMYDSIQGKEAILVAESITGHWDV